MLTVEFKPEHHLVFAIKFSLLTLLPWSVVIWGVANREYNMDSCSCITAINRRDGGIHNVAQPLKGGGE